MADVRWDQFTEATTLDTSSIIAIETDPTGSHAMFYMTILNFIKNLISNSNIWQKGASISNPPSGYMAMYCDANGFFYSKDSSGNLRKLLPARGFQPSIFPTVDTITTGDNKARIDIIADLAGMNLVYCMATCDTPSSSGAITIQIRNVTDSVDMLSTKLTIDANEYTSVTAAVPYVIDASKDDVAEGDRLAIDVDGAGTGAKGLRVSLVFQYPN